MCTSAPNIPAPRPAPVMRAETMDQASMDARDRERRRRMAAGGRASTILTGALTQAADAARGKTLLGS